MPQEIFGALPSFLWCLGLILYEVFQEWIVSFKKNITNFKIPTGCKADISLQFRDLGLRSLTCKHSLEKQGDSQCEDLGGPHRRGAGAT